MIKEELEKNKKLKGFLRKHNIGVDELEDHVKKNPKFTNDEFLINDIIWSYLNSIAVKNANNNDFYSSSSSYYSMALFLAEHDKKDPFYILEIVMKLNLNLNYSAIHYKPMVTR